MAARDTEKSQPNTTSSYKCIMCYPDQKPKGDHICYACKKRAARKSEKLDPMDTKSKQACKRSNSCANDKCGNTGEMIFNGMCNKCFKNTRRRSDSTINGILPVDPLTPAPLNLSHSLSHCTNAHDQCRNTGELKYEGLCKICYSRKDNRTQWLQKQKPEASEEEHEKKREDEKVKKEKQTLMDHVERLEASEVVYKRYIQELITERDTNLKEIDSLMKANEGKLQSLVNIKDELAASKVQYEKRLQQYDKELYKSKKKEAEQEKEMQAMMEQVERLKTMEVEYEKQLKEKKAENIVLNEQLTRGLHENETAHHHFKGIMQTFYYILYCYCKKGETEEKSNQTLMRQVERLEKSEIEYKKQIQDLKERIATLEKETATLQSKRIDSQLRNVEDFKNLLEEFKAYKKMNGFEEEEEADIERGSKDIHLSVLLNEGHMALIQSTVADKVPHQWNRIATNLGFSYTKCKAIKADKCDNHAHCMEMFGQWLRQVNGTGERERTLLTLLEALNKSDCKLEADALKEQITRMVYL